MPISLNQKIRELLSTRQKVRIQESSRKPSAVLIPIYFLNGQYFIIFTRRTELVHHHKGEISFPGGGYHPDDGNLLITALRESYEEIGLLPEDVEILGELDDFLTRGSNYIITPFVGVISPDYRFRLSDYEIAELIEIPVEKLLAEGCRREDPVELVVGRWVVPYVYAYQGKLITGATARILKQFLEIYSQAAGLPL